MPHPFAPALERAMLVNVDMIAQAARDLLAGRAAPSERLTAGGIGRSAGHRPHPAPPPAPRPGPVSAAASAPVSKAKPAQNIPGEAIKMPFGDLTVSEGKLVRWLKKLGESVAAQEIVAEIETDKAVVEIESPAAGVIAALLHQEGDVIKMGETIGVVGKG
jgi:2-oxoisovalerate dehydrogenase E1 component